MSSNSFCFVSYLNIQAPPGFRNQSVRSCLERGHVVVRRAVESAETDAGAELQEHEEDQTEEHAGHAPARLPVQTTGQRTKGSVLGLNEKKDSNILDDIGI